MKIILLTLLLFLDSISLLAQETPTWDRVYTFDDSKIEMNTAKVTYGGKNIARVRFRWTFDQSEVLSGQSQLRYKSQLEVIEFNCSDNRYRPYEITYFDVGGKSIRTEEMNPPVEWRTPVGMMKRLFVAGCELITRKTRFPVESSDAIEFEKVAKYARSFSQSLEQAKDFQPLIQNFFAADYLNGYIHDEDTNWFLNLDRDTAAKASPGDLQRFYVASLNAGYLSCLYLISQYHYVAAGYISDEKLIPPDIIKFINHHPYTVRYKSKQHDYNFLAQTIDGIEQLRSYIELLEGVSALMRKHVINVRAEQSKEYREMLEDWDWTFDLYRPKVRTCAHECFGLPKGTQLFEVNVPVFHLQIAEIRGELKIVSAMDYFY
jgi:hypothetical protein